MRKSPMTYDRLSFRNTIRMTDGSRLFDLPKVTESEKEDENDVTPKPRSQE